MSPEQIVSSLLKKQQKILHIGGDESIKDLMEAYKYTRFEVDQIDQLSSVDDIYDYAIVSDALELIEDPESLIKQIKNQAKCTVIYEYKYDEMEPADVNPAWKQPWKSKGLEFLLSREFDYINNIFLGYATLHICEMPYNPAENEEKEHPDAFR